MITPDFVKNLRLGVEPITDKTCILVESALWWVLKNTTITFKIDDLEKIPANVRLFVTKYIDIMGLRTGVASESIGSLSQSFNTDTSGLIYDAANDIFGDSMKTAVSFVSAGDRWR
jgi:hypothetical protein|nr:MAG TPA_asm: Protein of unknown function (DUF3199) [Caudoviricetes sp.]